MLGASGVRHVGGVRRTSNGETTDSVAGEMLIINNSVKKNFGSFHKEKVLIQQCSINCINSNFTFRILLN